MNYWYDLSFEIVHFPNLGQGALGDAWLEHDDRESVLVETPAEMEQGIFVTTGFSSPFMMV